MVRNLILNLVGGIVLFVWGFISHALLPWYEPAFLAFTDEMAVASTIERNTPAKGLYYLPFAETERGSDRLQAFVNVVPEGAGIDIRVQLVGGLIIAVISVFLVLSVVGRARPGNFLSVVGAFAMVGLTIGFVSHAYYWNWFQFPTSYIVVAILDTLVGWTLVGLIVGRFMTREEPGQAR